MFSNKQKTDEPFWSVKRQKAYKISRIIWIVQIAMALIASAGLIAFILIK